MHYRRPVASTFVLSFLLFAYGYASADPHTGEEGDVARSIESLAITERLRISESMIDAFYSFDADRLARLLAGAGESAAGILYYQGWAEGGHYKIIERMHCAAETSTTIRCAITVEDDLVVALGTGFLVTDVFSIAFDGSRISNVKTSSNDQDIYYTAYEWVVENTPGIMEGPCQGFFAGGPTPGDCARAMAEGYRRFAASGALPDVEQQP